MSILRPFRIVVLLSTLAVLLAACGSGDEPAPASASKPVELSGDTGGKVGDIAPELTGITGWLNSEPLTLEELRGGVVLIDVWTYTCVNCIRTLPYLQDWYAKYEDLGLEIIGLHDPEFDFEKVTANVQRAADELGVTWPIAQDNDFATWRAYDNRFWPAKYLIDKDGIVRYTHFGEGGYAETEQWIRDLLVDAGADVSGIALNDDPDPVFDPSARGTSPETQLTRELYGGWERNANSSGIYIADQAYYENPNATQLYSDPGDHANQFMYLEGLWHSGLESIEHARVTEALEDYIGLRFLARSVNAVVDLPDGAAPFMVDVTIDGQPLTAEEAGTDIIFVDGRSVFTVDQSRMYFVVSLPRFADRELRLASNSDKFALFAFTFGAYDSVD